MAKKAKHKVSADNLGDAILAELNDYDVVVGSVLQEAISKAADKAVEELERTSPKRTGDYSRSWSHDAANRPKSHKYKETIYAEAPHYRLTHLLENGHAKVNGGRVEGKPHISTAEQNVVTNVVSEIKALLGKG